MDVLAPVKKWLIGKALKKGVVSLAKLIVSYALAHGITVSADINGFSVNTSSEAAMVAVINSALAVLKNWLKIKWPEKFGWL